MWLWAGNNDVRHEQIEPKIGGHGSIETSQGRRKQRNKETTERQTDKTMLSVKPLPSGFPILPFSFKAHVPTLSKD